METIAPKTKLIHPTPRGETSLRELRHEATASSPMHFASLFSGIGGFELGLSASGHSAEVLCEVWDPALAVLRTRFPGVPIVTDVREVEHGSHSLPKNLDLLTAGFPCTDLSQAGMTAGIRGENSGLVYQVFRILHARRDSGRPIPWVVIENVPFMLQLSKGEAMRVIVTELENLGYRWAYRVVNSLAFGVPQRRRRVILVATSVGDPRDVLLADDVGEPAPPPKDMWRQRANGFYWTEGTRGLGWADDAVPTLKGGSTVGIPSSPAVVLPDGRIVKPTINDAERMQGFPVDWTLPAEHVLKRVYRWKLVGNAVTVDMAKWLGRRLLKPGTFDNASATELRKGRAWPSVAWRVDGPRMTADISEWPLAVERPALAGFVSPDAEPLSRRATAGFLARAESDACTLNFRDGFLDVVRAHLDTVSKGGGGD
jgi:DNA (cytosine-5)-methyltransferase 1